VAEPTEVEPRHPEQFSKDLADAVNRLLADSALRETMGRMARRRVEEQFSWTSIARQTLAFYSDVIKTRTADRRGLAG
jgi:glycosyltransferase involved in cell wall biosynthesis